MQRRVILKGGAAAAGTILVGQSNPTAAVELGMHVAPVGNELDSLLQPLVNTAQAQAVMEEYDLTGMIALNPVNVYYLTNTKAIGTKMRWQYPSFATLPRDPDQPTFLIVSSSLLWDLANRDRWVPNVISYSGPINAEKYMGKNALPMSGKPEAINQQTVVDPSLTLNTREQRCVDGIKNYQPSPAPEWGLARAMKESGITKGRVAVDDMRIAHLLERIGEAEDIEFIDGDNLFRRIRYIKSAPEIELMRLAGKKNAEAALATAHSIGKGMSYFDIERRFGAECALRGSTITFILAGVTLGLLPDSEVVPGKPFLIDAVSNFREYHGDFARTVVLGEPSKAVQKRSKAQSTAREAIFSILKPGTRYSEITKAGHEAYQKAGENPDTLIVNPHSLGLQHTDQPYSDKNPWRGPEDLALQKGMVITVDLPFIEVGFGAGHNEDLLLITDDGYEILHSEEEPLVIV
ncbi:MAG: M24 family metallopeptidase [Rhodospirillaceae bacterium]